MIQVQINISEASKQIRLTHKTLKLGRTTKNEREFGDFIIEGIKDGVKAAKGERKSK